MRKRYRRRMPVYGKRRRRRLTRSVKMRKYARKYPGRIGFRM